MGDWTLGLVVSVDEEERLLRPSVRVEGGLPFDRGAVGVALVDADGRLRACVTGRLDIWDLGTEVRLPSIAWPDGVERDEVLGWAFDVAVAADGAHRIRWRRYLETDTPVGADGELVLAGPSDRLRSKAEEEGWGPEAPWDARDGERLLDDLIASGLIGEAERKAIEAEAAETGMTTERVMVEQGMLEDRVILARLSELTGTEFLDLSTHPVDPDAARRIPVEMARRWVCVGIGTRAGFLTVAMSDPHNGFAMSTLTARLGPIYVVLATREDVLRTLDRAARDEPVSERVGEG